MDPLTSTPAGSDMDPYGSGASVGSGATAGGTTFGTSAGDVTGQTGATGPMGQSQGSGIYNQVKDRAVSQLDAQKARATEGLGSVAQAVRETTRQLRENQHDTVAQVVERAADQIERFSNHLRDRNVNELVDEAQRLARRQPAVFIGSSFAAGLLAARFIKASRPDRYDTSRAYETGYGRDETSGIGTAGVNTGSSYGTGTTGVGTGSSYDAGGTGSSTPFGTTTASGDATSFNTSDRPGTDPTGRGSF